LTVFRLRLPSVLCAVAGCALLVLCSGNGVAAVSPAWRLRATSATAGGHRPLLGVSCWSARTCTAVGGLFTERWNGGRWSVHPVAVPAFSDPARDFLGGVSCATPRACVAVGTQYPPLAANVDYDYSALAEVWNGRTWSDVSPAQGQTPNGFLQAVSCPSSTECIAVGQEVASPLAMGWDGSSWTVQPGPPNPPGMSILNGVSCTSAARCTAVGYAQPNALSPSRGLVESWDGTAWSVVHTPKTNPLETAILNAVSCTRRSCTAVGGVGLGQLVERWNGRRWSLQTTPKRVADAELDGVSCVSSTDCVAVGGLTNSSHQSLAERWNGRGWSVERTPTFAAGSLLWSVSCRSGADCVAVGEHRELPLVERWNGTTWSIRSAA
jgi:hypothetical protein